MNAIKIFLMSALLTVVTLTVYGQQRPASAQPGGQYDDDMNIDNPGRPGGGGPPMSGEQRDAVRKKIEAVRVWRLTEALKLDPESSAKLSSLLSSFDRQRRDIEIMQMHMMKTLQLAVQAPKPDQSKIKTDLEKLEKNHAAMQELKNNEQRALKNILTIEQQARYVVFQQQFMREMHRMIGNVRGNGQSGMGMVPGGGMGGGQKQGGAPVQTPAK